MPGLAGQLDTRNEVEKRTLVEVSLEEAAAREERARQSAARQNNGVRRALRAYAALFFPLCSLVRRPLRGAGAFRTRCVNPRTYA